MNGETVHKEIDMRHQLIESVPINMMKKQKSLENINMEILSSEIDMFFGPALKEKLLDNVQTYVENKYSSIMQENTSLKSENDNLKE